MKALFVVNCNYPYSSTGTNLLNRLFYEGGLLTKIDQIDVLGGKDNYSDPDRETVNGINVYRAWSWTTLPLDSVRFAAKQSCFKAIVGLIQKIAFKLEKKVVPFSFDDRYAQRAFYRALCRLDNSQYDFIVTMSGRYYHSIAVLKYCKKYKRKFVLYQVDPLGTNLYMPRRTLKMRRNLELEIYKNASAVITTPIICKEQTGIMPGRVLRKVEPMEFPLITPKDEALGNGVNGMNRSVGMFSGSIYGGIRDPHYTLRLFEPLLTQHKTELHFVGVRAEDLPEEYRKLGVVCHGTVPLEEAFRLMQQADYLINIGNSVVNQIPSKIFDYISTGKPIINICKSRNCPTMEYFQKYSLSINLFEEEDILETQRHEMEKFIRMNKGKRLEREEIRTNFERCTPEYCANQMQKIFKRVCEE